MAMDTPANVNSTSFSRAFIQNDPVAMGGVLFDHITNDWRDVVRHRINVLTVIFTGELSHNLPSQRCMHSVIPGSTLHVYSAAEQGDHFLAFKNPERFTTDLRAFLNR